MTNLVVTLMISFQTNCFTHSSYNDGRIGQRCVVERVCSVDHDLGDGHRLQLSVTNEIDTFEVEKIVRHHRHPILGRVEESISPIVTNGPMAPYVALPTAPKAVIYPPTPVKAP
jgi:hypothetical protein